jgi:methylthioribose-1-phosphate isomerase
MIPIQSVSWGPDGLSVRIVDQRRLPAEFTACDLRTAEEVREAIQSLAVRGAPAIGICAAMGIACAAAAYALNDRASFRDALGKAALTIREARPTAVNLGWAVDRVMARAAATTGDNHAVVAAVRDEATRILDEDRQMCEAIGVHGAELVPDGTRVLTHCNAGALATGGIGTALAPVYTAAGMGRRVVVLASETRPLFQGSRLTAWELSRAGIPVTVLADNMVASAMQSGSVDVCLVGADRIAANGDVANKIGTYGIAVLARYHGIPFYVAAPRSTIDPATPTGADMSIEERDCAELLRPFGVSVAPAGVLGRNPAFDITPAELLSGFVTDAGIHRPPFRFT